MRDLDIEEWKDRARRVDIWHALSFLAPAHAIKRRGKNGVGPCPACGGKDRFSVDGGKNLFYCRKADVGGDAIALAQYLTGASFLGACELVTGETMPRRQASDDVRREDPALVARRNAAAEADAQKRAREQRDYRDREIARARSIWSEGEAISGTPAEEYLRMRGVQPPPGARLRFHPHLKYWHHVGGEWRVLHTGFALLARIDDNANSFVGCHCTYLDLERRKGKAEICDPETGELLDAKKVRGSQKGGHVHLGGSPAAAHHLIMGEGIETTLSAREAMAISGRDLAGLMFWAGVNLPNIGGPSAGSVVHPTLTRTDAKGRVRRVKVPGAVPDLTSTDPALLPPSGIRRLTLLGDNDSDRFSTEQHLRRCAARAATRGVESAIAWPPPGEDFNDMICASLTQGAAA